MRTLCSLLVLFTACLGAPDARAQVAAGVPVEGFPNWEERVLLMLTNRARASPQADLADCPEGRCAERACYAAAMAPLAYSYPLNRAARLQASLLTDAGAFSHDSPCVLHQDLASRYLPDGSCDGAVSCACEGGVAGCSAGACTGPFERLALFGVGGTRAENLAGAFPTPREAFYAWLWEQAANASCGFSVSNGHRFNILNPALEGMGAGARPESGRIWVQDFGPARLEGLLIAGAHEPKQGGQATGFRVNFYDPDEKAPKRAWVNIGGLCHDLGLERGTLSNGTWLATVGVPSTACTRYTFTFEDAAGQRVSLPAAGAYLVGSESCGDWTGDVPASCEGGEVEIPEASTGCGCMGGAPGALGLAIAALLPLIRKRRPS